MSESYWTVRRRVKARVEEQCLAIALEMQQKNEEDQNIERPSTDNDDLPIENNTIGNDITSIGHVDMLHVDEDDYVVIERNAQGLQELGQQIEFDDHVLQGTLSEDQGPPSDDGDIHIYDDIACGSTSSSDDNSEIESDLTDTSLLTKLHDWAVTYSISHIALASLLSVLRIHHPDLPKDPRTLLGTVSNYRLKDICDGQYYHFGVKSAILDEIRRCQELLSDACLKLQINIDGLPLFKSSNAQFWPILGMIENLPVKPKVHILGLFYGNTKPKPAHEFLRDFSHEIHILQTEGIFDNGKHFDIKLSSVVCDTPARAFIKNVKAHNGYSGCDKCVQHGKYNSGRMTFPESDAQPRSDDNFAEMSDDGHHIGPPPCTDLGIGFVSQFPLDYMHLVCLGVMRRLLYFWIKGPLRSRIGAGAVARISDRLISMQGFIPTEFARKPRSLTEMDRWKATEFRQFLLYTGPVVLRDNLGDTFYKNFLLLHVAISILISPTLYNVLCDYAHELLVSFVNHFADLYGHEHRVYNIHGLTHLAAEVRRYGPLDNISCFPFENFLQCLKKMVRKPTFPLQQVIRRLSERQGIERPNQTKTKELRKKHNEGPLPSGYRRALQYSELQLDQFLVTRSQGNNCVGIKNDVVLVHNLLFDVDSKEKIVVFEKFRSADPFYTYPLPSSSLGIYRVSVPRGDFHTILASEITVKYVLLPYGSSYIAIPENHTN